MRVAVFKRAGLLELEDVSMPRAGPGQVVMKVSYCAICGSDLHRYAYGMMAPGVIMGHEVSGTIVEVGEGVEGWSVGDRVLRSYRGPLPPRFSSRDKGFTLDPLTPGGYADYLAWPASGLLRIPDGLSDEAASLTEPLSVAVHAIRLSSVKLGDAVVVLGAGPIGLLAVQCLRRCAPGLLVVSEPLPARRELALQLGADLALDPREVDPVAEVVRLTDGLGADVVFECAGSEPTLQEALEMARHRGQVALIAISFEPCRVSPSEWIGREVQLQASYAADGQDWKTSLDLIAGGQVQTGPLISRVAPLEEIQAAFQGLLQATDDVIVLIRP
ncbi:MAG: zinc-binding dehydrogenase [Chloroflexi bacterium]|nr:zinc-binding dehydrogenase [Chloroflexota bacterium]